MTDKPTLDGIIAALGCATEVAEVTPPNVSAVKQWLREAGFAVADDWDGTVNTRVGPLCFDVDGDGDLWVRIQGESVYTSHQSVLDVTASIATALSEAGA